MQKECARLVILKLKWASESPEGFAKHRAVGPISRVSESVDLGEG